MTYPTTTVTTPAADAPEPTVSEMREYLRAERPDLNVGARGRLSAEAVQAYKDAHPA